MLSLLTLLACGTVTNGPFDDDANFIAALPSDDRQGLTFGDDTVGETARGLGERAELVEFSLAESQSVNDLLGGVFGLLGVVAGLPPAERTEDGRRWGPAEVGCGVSGALRMARDASVYSWSASGHLAGEAGEATVLYGTHYGGATVATGDGTFVWDHSRWAAWCGSGEGGLLTVDYDNREGVDLLVTADDFHRAGDPPRSLTWAFRRDEALGDFELRTERVVEAEGSGALLQVAVRDRWIPGGGGRADAYVTGGGLGEEEWRWSQCWGPGGGLVYETDNLGVVEEAGSVADCAFADAAALERI